MRSPADTRTADVVVIGGGIAGWTAASDLAARGFKVVLAEEDVEGRRHARSGDLLQQVLARAGELAAHVRLAERYGVRADLGGVNYFHLVRLWRDIVDEALARRSLTALEAAGVRVIGERARLRSAGEVEIAGALVRCRAIVLATGSRPHIPPIPGLVEAGFLTPEGVLSSHGLPSSLTVLGGGAIGVTFAQAFSRIVVSVTLVERDSRLLADAEPDVSRAVDEVLHDDHVRVLTGWETVSVAPEGGERRMTVRKRNGTEEQSLLAGAILVATGRVPAVEDLGLEAAGVEVTARGVATDDMLRTTVPGVWACGDLVGVYHLNTMAEYEARVVSANIAAALNGREPQRTVNYDQVPRTYPTDPEIAQIGLREEEARALGPVVVGRAELADLPRAMALGDRRGLVKVVADGRTGRLIGVHIVGLRASDIISEASLALHTGLTVHDVAGALHPHLTMAEGLRVAAQAAVRGLRDV